MSNLSKIIGERLRNLRKENRLSQEELATRASLHPTYIGQLERGEKNATIESLEKVTSALNVSLEDLFKNLQVTSNDNDNLVLNKIYNLLFNRSLDDKEKILNFIEQLIHWKDKL
ncbi:helix-turn-helix domain-containing protein [Clostridium uliginosum]|uniref:DNA-binding transcriptional regulator, XRE-family HTH domain n=1 Tax=Clostridium uliginosum TaxID=119641 RepID=A0A1I1MZQ6_9CLOT|nr:helix-turn-helix transcriptional regulator [Clostridium uliginosum]SFC90934.1 DNA-binding transcriptional regulator, XRE-family HTH domain [Clostridium uliginosum]